MQDLEGYLKMLRAPGAECLQELWVPDLGDSVSGVNGIKLHINTSLYSIAKNRYTWLPTQGQLQDIIGYPSPHEILRHFYNGIYSVDEHRHDMLRNVDKYWYSFSTMEQLWLAFVMQEKFNKTWTGEEWVDV